MARTHSRRLLKLVVIGALALTMTVNVESCTVIGLMIGSAQDDRDGTGGPAMLMSVKEGREVTLHLWNGRIVTGRFAGWSRDSASVADSSDISAPLNARVRIVTGDRGEIVIPAERIAKVTMNLNGGKLTGMLFGLTLDALVIAAATSSQHHDSGCQTSPYDKPLLSAR